MYRIRLNTATTPSEHGLYLPARVLAGLGVAPGSHFEIQVGQKVSRASIGAAQQPRVAAELKHKLRLPPGVLRLHVDMRDNRIVLGPFLGILARPQISSPYGEQTSFFRRLIARAKAMHIYAFVFEPEDVRLEDSHVIGHRPYKTTTTWVTRRCPVPDVVFDRGFFRGAEKKRAQKLLDRLGQEFGVRIFNEDFGTKWDVYQALLQDAELAEYLPETAVAGTEDVVRDFIKRHKMVYIKPANGNQGRNVFRVRLRHNRLSYEAHLRGGRMVRSSLSGVPALMKSLAETKEKYPFIVQQGLELKKLQGRTADVRALVQRDRSGKWRLTGAGVRIGGSSLISNLHAGGSAAKLDVLVPRLERKAKLPDLKAHIAKVTLRVAEVLGRRNLLGELGVDLGLDNKGRLWIIEVNLKPGRATFRRAGLDDAWRRSGIAPLEYALYLWAHVEDTPEEEIADPLGAVEAVVGEEESESIEAIEEQTTESVDEPEETPVLLGGYVPVSARSVLS